MLAPNVVSVAIIVFLIELADGLSKELPALQEPWVPFAIVGLGAAIKALQVILGNLRQQSSGVQVSRLRQLLLG